MSPIKQRIQSSSKKRKTTEIKNKTKPTIPVMDKNNAIRTENCKYIANSICNIISNSSNQEFWTKCLKLLKSSKPKEAHCAIFEILLLRNPKFK